MYSQLFCSVENGHVWRRQGQIVNLSEIDEIMNWLRKLVHSKSMQLNSDTRDVTKTRFKSKSRLRSIRPIHLQNLLLYNVLDLFDAHNISSKPFCEKGGTRDDFTSKNRLSHQTWNIPSPMSTPSWKMLHHFTRALVDSAVLRWVRSRTTIYPCSSLTWTTNSPNVRTRKQRNAV